MSLLLALALALPAAQSVSAPTSPPSQGAGLASVRAAGPAQTMPPGSAPIFVENRGAWDSPARFVGRAGGVVAGVEPGALSLHLDPPVAQARGAAPASVRLRFEGAAEDAQIAGELPREALFSQFLGNDPDRWVRGARSFDAVRIHDLYAGVDLLLRSDGAVLEYDLILAPDADLGQVRVAVEGAERLEIDEMGALVVHTAHGPLVQPAPHTFQPLPDGGRREVRCSYVLLGEDSFGFTADEAESGLALVVDPQLLWSTYIGSGWGLGVGDKVWAIAVGPDGDVYAAGEVEGPLFPTTSGAFAEGHPQGGDIFVARFRGEDGTLLYSCILGGSEGTSHWQERPLAIAIDDSGEATVGGRTHATNFPTTPGVFKTTSVGGAEGFIVRLSGDGTQLVWSTYLGAVGSDEVRALALAPSGAVVVGGETGSPDFPVTPGAWVDTFPGNSAGFITRIDPTGSFLEWSSFVVATGFGQHGTPRALVLDEAEHVLVAAQGADADPTPGAWAPGGRGAAILKLDSTGSELLWYSKFGKPLLSNASIIVEDLAIDAFGNPVVLGWTNEVNFPTTPGAFQTTGGIQMHGFVVRLHASGSHALYSTYLGPGQAWSLAVDASGMATVTGSGLAFPMTPGAYQTTPFPVDLVVSRLSPAGDKLLYSTFIGGPNTDISTAVAIGATRRASVGGFSNGGYPTTPHAPFPSYIGGQTDAVVTTFDLVLEGLELFGESIPACLGPLHANGTEMPRADAVEFAFFCSGAPPSASGMLFLGTPSPAPFGQHGFLVLPTLARLPVQADRRGWVETSYSLTAFAPGATFAAQYLFRNPPTCPGPRPWSTSNGLLVTVQP